MVKVLMMKIETSFLHMLYSNIIIIIYSDVLSTIALSCFGYCLSTKLKNKEIFSSKVGIPFLFVEVTVTHNVYL